ncbi:type II toxin-antitoxin system Rv0910 family toxin [Amycolatopsis nigrescens]|uniref:type II toxin-antitoxin system Rv0910 family toxin n=1 Tax=Amycolatopsis nigrescens TaxID=381445 RepID=UPI00035D1B88|nr:SRPBCC family protein [Amycolatopsis nigrescens]
MAKVTVCGRVPTSPEQTWATAADLPRFADWLTMHEAWRGQLPSEFTEGTTLTSVVTIKGLRNRIAWRVVSYDEPHSLAICGDGVGGVRVDLVLSIRPEGDGSLVGIDAQVTGKPVFGPIAMTLGRAVRGELTKSLANLEALLRSPSA